MEVGDGATAAEQLLAEDAKQQGSSMTTDVMETDSAHKRRSRFQRSLTLSALSQRCAAQRQQQQQQLAARTSDPSATDDLQIQGHASSAEATSSASRSPRPLTRDRFVSERHHGHVRPEVSPSTEVTLARTRKVASAAPSVLLSKVKDRIREKVCQTEWANAAAIMQERRQKANADILGGSLTAWSLEQQQSQCTDSVDGSCDTRRNRARSQDSSYSSCSDRPSSPRGGATTSAVDPAELRLGFARRRSISDESHDRPPVGKTRDRLHPRGGATQRSSTRHTLSQGSIDSACSSFSDRSLFTDSGTEDTTIIKTSMRQYRQPEIVLDSQARHHLLKQDESDSVPVKECVFDDQGQTWDVYGAEFDAELLGQAIQKRVESMMTSQGETESSEDENRQTDTNKSIWNRLFCMMPAAVKRK